MWCPDCGNSMATDAATLGAGIEVWLDSAEINYVRTLSFVTSRTKMSDPNV